MFKYDLMEATTHNKWYHILLIHLAFSMFLLQQVVWSNVSLVAGLSVLFLGAFSFSLLEYLLHRFLFHSENYLFNNRIVRYVHFILHGIHHMLPVDP